MSAIGSMVGFQEGIEAGLVTGGLASTEVHAAKALTVGLGATALGVLLGHEVGDSLLQVLDSYVGDGGIGFVPAVAIGSSVMWHNLRDKVPQQSAQKVISSLPYLAIGAGFAAFEGTESGILTASTHSSLLAAEMVTLSAATATTAVFGGIRLFASKLSPKNALRTARGVALVPATYLGIKATPELIANPKPVGVGIAILGSAAIIGAVGSFFKSGQKKTV